MKVGNLTISLTISNNCFKHAPKWMVSSLIFQKFSGEGPPPQTPPPAFSRASPSVRASPSILGRFAPSTRASLSILGRFAPSIRASPLTFDWGPRFGPPKINSWIRPCVYVAWSEASAGFWVRFYSHIVIELAGNPSQSDVIVEGKNYVNRFYNL